jgi:hypothetical protein
VDNGPGFASYTLGQRDAWRLESVTFTAVSSGPNDDDDTFLDCLDGSGGVIYRQYLGTIHQPPAFYSLTAGAEPFWDQGDSTGSFPQDAGGFEGGIVTMRLAPVTLGPGCVLRVYAALGQPAADADPFASLDTSYSMPDLHLWVEDVDAAGGGRLDVGNPLLLGVGG